MSDQPGTSWSGFFTKWRRFTLRHRLGRPTVKLMDLMRRNGITPSLAPPAE